MQPYTQVNSASQRSAARPMVKHCLAFMGGIIIAQYFQISFTFILFMILILVSICSILLKRNEHNQSQSYNIALILLLFLLFGIIRTEIQIREWQHLQQTTKETFFQEEHVIRGTIEDYYSSYYTTKIILGNVSLIKGDSQSKFPGKIEIILSEEQASQFKVGDPIQTTGVLNPVWGTSVPTGMDWLYHRYSKQLLASVRIDQDTEITKLHEPAFHWRSLSHYAIKQIEEQLPQVNVFADDKEMLALISSIAFGIRSNMPEELQYHLQRSGLAHITSISGLHVTFVLGLIFLVLNGCGLKRKRAAWFTFVIGVIYIFIVGVRIPVLRSVMMAFVLFGQHIFHRRSDSLNTLAIVALIILILNPMELFLPSFQLSFAAVLFLILYSPVFNQIDNTKLPTLIQWLGKGIAASAIVTIGLAPIIIYYFHYLSWGAVFGNIPAVFLLSIFLPLVYLWALMIHVPQLGEVLGQLVGYVGTGLIEIIHFFGGNALFTFDISALDIWHGVFVFLCVLILSQPMLIWFSIRSIQIRGVHVAIWGRQTRSNEQEQAA